MQTRAYLIICLIAGLILDPAGKTNADVPAQPPNIIIILADDLGIGDLGGNGAPIKTPNVDQLAQNGISLGNFYASAHVCSPSRAGLLTGRYAIRMGLAYKVIEPHSLHGIPDSELTLAELLQTRNYRTALIGKWHLGHKPEFWPTRHGFEYFYGLPYSNDMKPLALYRGEKIIETPVEQSTLTRRYTEEAKGFIRAHRDERFFLYLAHTAPHIPLAASTTFAGGSAAGLYGDVVEELDWSVGEVVSTLHDLALERKTLVIFSSDNGAWFEGSNGVFRDMKGLTWDGGYRVPLIAVWPGVIEPGRYSNALTMNIDLLPTLAALAGAETDEERLDGRNIWPVLNGAGVSPHEYLVLFDNEEVAAVRTQRWKYVVRGWYRDNFVAFDRFRDGLGFEYDLLFDMTAGQPERYSLARTNPVIVERFKTLVETLRAEFAPLRTHAAPDTVP